jgi:site-specific DNA-methyltransferase (adenine-specific)
LITPNALFQADCIDVVMRLETESIDLIYLDPPPALQEGGRNSSPDDSATASHEQLHFISKVCQQAHRVLSPNGVLFFHAQPVTAFTIRLILNQVFGEDHFRNEIVWEYGQAPTSRSCRPGGDEAPMLFLLSWP